MLLTTTPARFTHPSSDERRAVYEADRTGEKPVDLGRVLRQQERSEERRGKVRVVYTRTTMESLIVFGD